MADRSFVEFVDVRKSYDRRTLVIKDLNLSVRKGEFLTLLGPSGSGKTTTLLMLAGFEEPTSGRIELDGKSLSGVPPYRRDLGMVFQDYALFPHMTVRENVAYPLTLRKVDKNQVEREVEAALGMVQLDGYGHRNPAELSGGQQQRVALARALVFRPKLILMDEPLGALDKQLREQMQLEIRAIQKRLGITAVYVTHDQLEALTMSDRVAVFHNGTIQQLDTPSQLYEFPRSLFVAQFIGENNAVPGIVREAANGMCVVETDDGNTYGAHATSALIAGQRVFFAVRPERIALKTNSHAYDNSTSVLVEELIYQGDNIRVRTVSSGRGNYTLKVSNFASMQNVAVGTTLSIGWSAADSRAFAATTD